LSHIKDFKFKIYKQRCCLPAVQCLVRSALKKEGAYGIVSHVTLMHHKHHR